MRTVATGPVALDELRPSQWTGTGRRTTSGRADAAVSAATANGIVPLTRRQAHLTQHAGQISLPGGTLDAGETPAEAAVARGPRGAGDHPADVALIGSLTPVYVFNSNFLITPWVAVVVSAHPISTQSRGSRRIDRTAAGGALPARSPRLAMRHPSREARVLGTVDLLAGHVTSGVRRT